MLLIFINDQPLNISTVVVMQMHLYADDTTVTATANVVSNLKTNLTLALHNAKHWAYANR